MAQTFAEFEAAQRAEGFDEVVVREWPPLTVVDTHVHRFAARGLVVRGEMWLIVGEQTEHLRPGATFTLAPGVTHSEHYGEQGATYWVARRG
jgi:quercetin dioxygenase-like cupin family protein